MAGSRVGLFDNLNIPIHRDAQHREDGLDAFPFVSTFIDGDSIRARVYATNRGAAEPPHVLHAHTSTK